MIFLFITLLFMNGLTEYLVNKIMMALGVLEAKYAPFHAACAILRMAWIFLTAWFTISLPVFLIVLFILLALNIAPYAGRKLLMNHLTLIIYLIYASLLMTIIGCIGLSGRDTGNMMGTTIQLGIILNTTSLIFNAICALLLHYHPKFLWRKDYEKSNIMIYTCFLSLCIVYHILDAFILTRYPAHRINYLLLVSGDILILFLVFNFLSYNYVFAKSEEVRQAYEENEILTAQRFFEKESLRKLSRLDSLTKAYNRREICSIMSRYMQERRPLVCVFVDLDGLKRMNDKYGHTYGDLMLKRFAETCTGMMQETGFLARIGGDEFLLVFPDADINDIEQQIKGLQLKLLEPEDSKDKISFSYGISFGEETVDGYISAADQRMYIDKNRKRCN